MITYKPKRGAFGKLLLRRWTMMRRPSNTERRDIRRYRRIWFWHEDRWNQRHGISKESV